MKPSDDRRQPSLEELLGRYLARQAEAHAAGFAAGRGPEVVPFEAAPARPVDPRTAWTEAVAAIDFMQPATDRRSWPVPPDWADLVVSREPATALAFALGNFPQAVRDVNALLQAASLALLRPNAGRPIQAPELAAWADRPHSFPQLLLVLGVCRVAKQFDRADELVRRHRGDVPAEWRPAWANEVAALAWHRGRAEEAMALWQAQAETAPVLFNRGMAALFTERPDEARTWLGKAVRQLPDTGSWHHLGRLYLALADMRR